MVECVHVVSYVADTEGRGRRRKVSDETMLPS